MQKKEKERLEMEAKQLELEEKRKRGVVPNSTNILDPINRELDKSKMLWSMQDDQIWKSSQMHRSDIIRNQFILEQDKELRRIVDELMRLELERLQAAVDRDRGNVRCS